MFDNKRAMSPLVATIILVLFSLLLGTVTMNLGKSYIEDVTQIETKAPAEGAMQKYIGNSLYQCAEIEPSTQECLAWELVSQ